MKKLSILLCLFISFSFLSCSDDDDDNNNVTSEELVGTWSLTKTSVDEIKTDNALVNAAISTIGQSTLDNLALSNDSQSKISTFIFNENGKLTTGGETELGTYSLSSNKLTISFIGSSLIESAVKTYDVDISDNTLFLYLDATNLLDNSIVDFLKEMAGGLDFSITKLTVKYTYTKQ